MLGLAIWLGFVDMLPAAIVDVSGCSQQWLGPRALLARVYLEPVYSVMSIYIVVGGAGVFVILNILLIFLEMSPSSITLRVI